MNAAGSSTAYAAGLLVTLAAAGQDVQNLPKQKPFSIRGGRWRQG